MKFYEKPRPCQEIGESRRSICGEPSYGRKGDYAKIRCPLHGGPTREEWELWGARNEWERWKKKGEAPQ